MDRGLGASGARPGAGAGGVGGGGLSGVGRGEGGGRARPHEGAAPSGRCARGSRRDPRRVASGGLACALFAAYLRPTALGFPRVRIAALFLYFWVKGACLSSVLQGDRIHPVGLEVAGRLEGPPG